MWLELVIRSMYCIIYCIVKNCSVILLCERSRITHNSFIRLSEMTTPDVEGCNL